MAGKSIPSETRRQILVRDGERCFRKGHSRFLTYQHQFLAEMTCLPQL